MISKNQVKYIHSLRLPKTRDKEQAFLAEGTKLAEELLKSHYKVRQVYGTASWISGNQELIAEKKVNVQEISEADLKKISNLVTPNEVIAVVNIPAQVLPSDPGAGEMVLILDRIQDPGNMGTIIRTADWFGIRHIFCSRDTVDLYNPKVIQSTMGSVCRVSVHYLDLEPFLQGLKAGRKLYGAFAEGENIYEFEPKFPAAVIIGNESKGISAAIAAITEHRVSIPTFSSGAESLNAAVAAGIICSEFSRHKSTNNDKL